jgi:hypothetical protein
MLRRFGRLAVMVESSDRAGGRERTIQSFEGSIGGRRQRPRGCSWNLYWAEEVRCPENVKSCPWLINSVISDAVARLS